jgi:hypothetical protein
VLMSLPSIEYSATELYSVKVKVML